MRGESDRAFAGQAAGGEDVPDIFGKDVDGEVVDFTSRVSGLAEGVKLAEIAGAQPHFGGLDLNAEEAAVVLDGDVVARSLSPGLSDVEAEAGGDGHEEKLDPLATTLVGREEWFAAMW